MINHPVHVAVFEGMFHLWSGENRSLTRIELEEIARRVNTHDALVEALELAKSIAIEALSAAKGGA